MKLYLYVHRKTKRVCRVMSWVAPRNGWQCLMSSNQFAFIEAMYDRYIMSGFANATLHELQDECKEKNDGRR